MFGHHSDKLIGSYIQAIVAYEIAMAARQSILPNGMSHSCGEYAWHYLRFLNRTNIAASGQLMKSC